MPEETIIEFEANEERRGRTLRFREWLEFAHVALLRATGIDYYDGGADEARMRLFYAEYVNSGETVAASTEALADWWIEKYGLDLAEGMFDAEAEARIKKFLLHPYDKAFEFEEGEVLAEGGCGEYTFNIETGEVLRIYPDNGQGGEEGSWADVRTVDVETTLRELEVDPATVKDGETFATLNMTIICDDGVRYPGTMMHEDGTSTVAGVVVSSFPDPNVAAD